MKVLITGITGWLGRGIAAHLLQEGHSVVGLTRSAAGAAAGPRALVWDPAGGTLPDLASEGLDAVIHLAGESVADGRWSEEKKRRIHDSRVLTTRTLTAALAPLAAGRPLRFLSASATGFYGSRGDEMLDENSPPGSDFLAGVCRDWETAARFAAPGLTSASVRIGMVLGRDGGALAKLLPLFRAGLGGPAGTGRQWMSWIHYEDVVRLFAFLLNADPLPRIVNATAPHPVTNAEFSRQLGQALHRPAFLRAPAFALRAALGEMSVLVLGSQRVEPKAALQAGFRFHHSDLEPALRAIVQR